MISSRSRSIVLVSLPLFLVAGQSARAQVQTSAQIYEATSPALVLIRTDKGAGSGFLIDSTGLIATALHVVEDAETVQIETSTGDIFDTVQLMARDERRDLGILKVAGFDLPVLRLGNSNDLSPGDELVVIGNPLGEERLQASVSEGVLSGLRDLGAGFQTIQTDAAISPGHSGSPVLNRSGEVVGVVSFRIVGGESLNFAIPVNYLRGLQGMQSQPPLTAWSTPVGDADVSLVASDASDVTFDLEGRWRALQTDWIYTIRQDGDRIYVISDTLNDLRTSINFDLTRGTVRDVFSGTVNYRGTCTCLTCGAGNVYFGTEVAEFLARTDSRLEVRWQLPRFEGNDLADAVDCRGGRFKDGPRMWVNRQIWIKEF